MTDEELLEREIEEQSRPRRELKQAVDNLCSAMKNVIKKDWRKMLLTGFLVLLAAVIYELFVK